MTIGPLLSGLADPDLREKRGALHNSSHSSVHDFETAAYESATAEMAALAFELEAVRDPAALLQTIVARGRSLVAGSGFAALRCAGRARWSVLAAADISSHRYGELHAGCNQRSSTKAPPRADLGPDASSLPDVLEVDRVTELARLGISHVVVAPIGLPHLVLGTFNWYVGDLVDEQTLHTVRSFARHASVAYLHARERQDLASAVESHGLIGQAQGILMCSLGLDADAAFAVLRRVSQQGNIKLHQVAGGVVATGALPPA